MRGAQVPQGRLKPCAFRQPSLRDLSCRGRWFPTLKHWALVTCPSGTLPWPCFAKLGLTRAKDVLGGSRQSGAPFPLTPALSLKEREPRWPRHELAGAHDMRESDLVSPSPLGRGRGEGERSLRRFHRARSSEPDTLQTRFQFLVQRKETANKIRCRYNANAIGAEVMQALHVQRMAERENGLQFFAVSGAMRGWHGDKSL